MEHQATADYDGRYLAGIRLFNEHDYFEAHEVWESLWMDCAGPERSFYQGLIQAAVALLHFGNGNVRGAVKLYRTSRDYMAKFPSPYLGLDIAAFWRQMERCFAELLADPNPSPALEPEEALLPVVTLDPARELARSGRISGRGGIRDDRTRGTMSEDLSPLDAFDGTARLFPLPNVVLFPHVMLPLHIFESRYRQLTADALGGDRLITLVLLRPGWEADYEGRPVLHSMACLGRIVADQRLPDGRYNLLLRGLCRGRILNEVSSPKLYRSAHLELLCDNPAAEQAKDKALRRKLGRLAKDWLAGLGTTDEQLGKLLDSELSLGALGDILSFALPLAIEFKQELLEELDVHRRIRQLVRHLEHHTPPPAPTAAPRQFPPEFSPN